MALSESPQEKQPLVEGRKGQGRGHHFALTSEGRQVMGDRIAEAMKPLSSEDEDRLLAGALETGVAPSEFFEK